MTIFVKIKKNWYYLVFFVILTLAFIPRSIEVFSGNYLFGFDQGLFYQDVREIVENKKITLIGAEVGGIGGFFQGPGWNYLLVIPYVLFNGDPYGGMVFVLLVGMATVGSAFLLFRNKLGIFPALFISFLLAVSPGIISQSRFIWPPFIIPPLTLMLIYFVLKSYKKPLPFIPLAIGTIGIMTHFEIATGFTLLVSSVIAFLLLSFRQMMQWKVILYSFLAFIVTQSTLIVFDLRHNFISSKGILNLILHNKTVSSSYNFQNHLDIFKDSFFSVSYNLPLFFITFVICLISGYFLIKDKKASLEIKKILLFIMVNIVILFLIFLPLKMPLWSWWVLEVPVFICVFFGITLSYILQKRNGKILIALLFIAYGYFYANNTYNWYKNDFYDYGGTAKMRGKIDAIDYIYKDAKGEKFGLFVFTPPVYTYPYDYLLHWYAQEKYGYTPSSEKKGTFYLLMEPDSQKPTSYIGWMKTVIIDGKVEKEVKLPSGFIIQKRVGAED